LTYAVQRAANALPTPDWVSAYFFDAGCAALRTFGEDVPVYVEIGESDFRAYEQFMSPSEIGSWLKRFAGVIAVSEPNFEVLQKYADLGRKVSFLENGIDTVRFKPGDRRQARAILRLPQEAFIVGFTGSFIERKGPLRLLAALNMIPDAFGLFLGRGLQVPRGERVLYAGPVSNETVPLMLAACDVYCLPSLAESLSCAELEAAACGLPLVVSDRPFNRTFLDDMHAMFVEPTSPGSIAEGIKLLMASSTKRQEMATACRLMAEDHSLAHRVTRLFEIVSSRG
jgi:glycosyltransferase involved in cell wall biosynthesis